jgi:hypothetical protein
VRSKRHGTGLRRCGRCEQLQGTLNSRQPPPLRCISCKHCKRCFTGRSQVVAAGPIARLYMHDVPRDPSCSGSNPRSELVNNQWCLLIHGWDFQSDKAKPPSLRKHGQQMDCDESLAPWRYNVSVRNAPDPDSVGRTQHDCHDDSLFCA